jgi:uncharacterized protein (UPF0216 family)
MAQQLSAKDLKAMNVALKEQTKALKELTSAQQALVKASDSKPFQKFNDTIDDTADNVVNLEKKVK